MRHRLKKYKKAPGDDRGANQKTLQPDYSTGSEVHTPPSNFGFTGICPCGGRVTCYMKGRKPKRASISTCGACGRCEVVQES
jgi:hypothetical protein